MGTSPNGYVPDGAASGTGLEALLNTDRSEWERLQANKLSGGFQTAQGGWKGFINNAIEGVTTWFTHLFDGMSDRQDAFEDGQIALNERQDLLSPLLDYGSAYAGSTGGIFNAGQVSFNNQVGPFQNCRLSGGRFILEDQGLWDLRARLYFDYINVLGGVVVWELRVLTPSGSVFSRQYDQFSTQSVESREINTSVTVPGTGYQVQVYITSIAALRGSLAGPAFNRLTVQHITRDTSFQIQD